MSVENQRIGARAIVPLSGGGGVPALDELLAYLRDVPENDPHIVALEPHVEDGVLYTVDADDENDVPYPFDRWGFDEPEQPVDFLPDLVGWLAPRQTPD